MRRAPLVLALVLGSVGLLASATPASRAGAQASGGPGGTRPECVDARAEARMQAYGWDHVVVVRNGCAAPVDCRVSTDVNPSVTPVRLGPGETRETLTWRGSPASVFVAQVECEQARR